MSGTSEPLLAAVRDGAPESVRRLLDDGADVLCAGSDGQTALHLAIAGADGSLAGYRITGMLLAAGADPNARGPDGKTALHAAALEGDERLIAMLLDRGANPRLTLTGAPEMTAEALARKAGHGPAADFIASYTTRRG